MAKMQVTPQCVVALTWTLKDTLGEVLDELKDPVEFLVGGDDLLAKIEEALQGHVAGDKLDLHLEPEDAFGDYDAKLVRMENVTDLPPDVTVGGYLVAEQDGNEVVWRVTDIADGRAVLDGNHELAGQRLRFEAKVIEVRPATQEEISHGHIHGPHGHHH